MEWKKEEKLENRKIERVRNVNKKRVDMETRGKGRRRKGNQERMEKRK